MALFVILNVDLDTREWVQSVGRIVLLVLEMMEHSVLSQRHMVEEPVTHCGTRTSVRENTVKDVKKTASFGIQNVDLATKMWDAAFAHLIVKTDKLILVSHVPKSHMEEE